MVTIIPAILSHNKDDFMAKLKVAELYFREAQIDFMDGVFVANKTVAAKELRGLQTHLHLEAHLMVQTPETWVHDVLYAKCRKIIVHQELGAGLNGTLQMIRGLGAQVGVAVNPDTEIEALDPWWGRIDTIQVMGVIPGHYGAKFESAAVEKIRYLRERGFPGTIQVDGGVTLETALMLKRAGVNKLVVGHYFFGDENNPTVGNVEEKLKELQAAIKQ